MSRSRRLGLLAVLPAFLLLSACASGLDDTQHPGTQNFSRSGPDNQLPWGVAGRDMRSSYEFCREQAAIVDRSQPSRDSERLQCMAEHGWDRIDRTVPDDLYRGVQKPREPLRYAERGKPTTYYYKIYE